MIKCEQCGTEKVLACGYGRGGGRVTFWAGSECPKCCPARAKIKEEPEWWPGHKKEEPQIPPLV